MIRPDDSSHYYEKDGTPRYEAGLKEARNEWLLPSVTTILKIKAKPGVEAWSANLLLQSATEVNSLMMEYEPSEWKDAVVSSWKDKKAVAPELGTKFHAQIDEILTDRPVSEHVIPAKTLDAFLGWMVENDVSVTCVEQCFADPNILGVAGRIDAAGTWRGGRKFVADWKTQGTKNGRVRFYNDYAYQLAANAAGLGDLDVDLVSVVISTTEPGIVTERVWGDNHIWLQGFQAFHKGWCIENDYDPFTGGRMFK